MKNLHRLCLGVPCAVFAAASLVPILAQTPPSTPKPAPPALWTVTADIAAPESAFYDAASNSVFVSNINGGVTDKDGNGYISRLTPEGRVVSAKWVTGLNGPKGLRSVGGTLWAADIDEVVGIEIASGRISSRVKIDGATFLNDLATAPDGTVYVSDSQRRASTPSRTESVDLRRGRGCHRDAERRARGRQSRHRGIARSRRVRPRRQRPRRGRAGGRPSVRVRSRHEGAHGHHAAARRRIDGIEPDGSGGASSPTCSAHGCWAGASGTARTLLTFPARVRISARRGRESPSCRS
jgi:hypothetical protein